MRTSDNSARTYFRSVSRFYEENGSWFYATREGDHGPFASRQDAEADARLYCGLQSHLEHVKDKPRADSDGQA